MPIEDMTIGTNRQEADSPESRIDARPKPATILEPQTGVIRIVGNAPTVTVLPEETQAEDLNSLISLSSPINSGSERRAESSAWDLNSLNSLLSPEGYPKPLAAEAYHGIAGRIALAIEPHTEADPAALLVQTLISIGNALGRGPHAYVGATRHGVALMGAMVGETSGGRKGTGWNEVRSVVRAAAPDWADCVTSGLATGEGLIHALSDQHEEQDKRMLLVEAEFSRTLRVASRPENIVTNIIRQAWDGDPLSNITKKAPETASDHHISIIAHTTSADITRFLSETDMLNGFGNRFLWALSRRSKCLPFGGTLEDGAKCELVYELRDIIEQEATEHTVSWGSARDLWVKVYPVLGEPKGGLLGAMVARSEAQVLRLALLYAVLDRSRTIDEEHLIAALALWRYCEDSARFIFGGRTGNNLADIILSELEDRPEGLSRTAISNLFARHATKKQIKDAIQVLKDGGLVEMKTVPTAGRPSEVWKVRRHAERGTGTG